MMMMIIIIIIIIKIWTHSCGIIVQVHYLRNSKRIPSLAVNYRQNAMKAQMGVEV